MKFKIGSFFKTSFINIHRSNKISDSRGTGTNNRRYIVLFITSSKYVCKKRNDVIKLKNIECYPPPFPAFAFIFSLSLISFWVFFFLAQKSIWQMKKRTNFTSLSYSVLRTMWDTKKTSYKRLQTNASQPSPKGGSLLKILLEFCNHFIFGFFQICLFLCWLL